MKINSLDLLQFFIVCGAAFVTVFGQNPANCKVKNLKATLAPHSSGLFEWSHPANCKATDYVIKLSTSDTKALTLHKANGKKIIWENKVPSHINSFRDDKIKYFACINYSVSVEVIFLTLTRKHGREKQKFVQNTGNPVSQQMKASNVQPFKSVTFVASKNSTLNITLDPSPLISLCKPEYQLEIFNELSPFNKNVNCTSAECMIKVLETKVNQTSVLLNVSGNSQIKQCGNYVAVIKLLDSNAHNIKQSIPFTFDYQDKSESGLPINNFKINSTGPEWIYLTWSPPDNHTECIKYYQLEVYNSSSLMNVTVLSNNATEFNVSHKEYYNILPCSNYSFILLKFIGNHIVSATINGSSENVAPGEVGSIRVVNETSSSLTLSWSKPSFHLSCAIRYSIEFTDKRGMLPVDKVDLTETSFTKTNLYACVLYTISIITKGTEMDSHRVSVNGTTSAEVPGAVETFKQVNLSSRSLVLNWTLPGKYPDCVTYYNLSWYNNEEVLVNSVKINDSRVNSYDVTELSPCSNYTFSIFCGGINGGCSQTTNLTTSMKEEVPGPVNNLSVSSEYFELIAMWQPPSVAVDCVDDYIVHNKILNGTNSMLSNEMYSYKIIPQLVTGVNNAVLNTTRLLSDLAACVEYEVIVTAMSHSKAESQPASVSQTTLAYKFSEPSEGKLINISQQWALLQWRVPFTNRNQCPLTSFVAECHETEGLPLTWETNVRDLYGYITINATNLKVYTSYICTGHAENSAGWSNASTPITFQTMQAAPSAPTKIHVLEKMSNSIEISWDKPLVIPGELQEYNVTVICDGPQYFVPKACSDNITSPSYSVTLSKNAEQVLLDGLSPYQKYSITVAAATKAGYGPPSNPINALTLSNVSDIVRDLKVTVMYNESIISWAPPCFSNGIVLYYNIKLTGTREGYDPDRIRTWNSTCENEELCELYLTGLLPEYNYVVTVCVFVDSVSISIPATVQFKSSAEIPEEPATSSVESISPNPKATSNPSEQAMITLTSNLFSNKAGDINYYAILIAQDDFLGPKQSGLLKTDASGNLVWPEINSWANATSESSVLLYQATPCWWNPFKEGSLSEKVEYTIGSESCSKDNINVFCNGPLNPATDYKLRIRAFTSAGFRDSPAVQFTTEPAFPYYMLMKFIFTLCAVLLLTFIVFVVYSSLRRSSWNSVKKKQPNRQTFIHIPDEKYLKELPVKKFLAYSNELLTDNDKMMAEFLRLGALSAQIQQNYSVAQLPENKKKNRYINILPYDVTRVVLEDSLDSDYINASYIKDDIDHSVVYIACQAPKDDTSTEFWKMIYQCKVQSIVMLCNFTEQGKENEDVCLAVTHFHFYDWPDFGVPAEPETMLKFCKVVRAASVGSGMIAIHCSAGVGRTGTFIAVDLLLRHIELTKKISVFKTVLRLREQRANMVQTEIQYNYIYKSLKHALENPLQYFKRGYGILESKRKRTCNGRRGSRFSVSSNLTNQS
ncbi:protein tyrosine phosphatase 52F isoform X2 [Lycorma delicatula]|uniref:protein tyrosine phosphatase 52F isoform X2 n=1 Tax=Lycorma delicatula TaxID=130591 RepID=UPI003F51337B